MQNGVGVCIQNVETHTHTHIYRQILTGVDLFELTSQQIQIPLSGYLRTQRHGRKGVNAAYKPLSITSDGCRLVACTPNLSLCFTTKPQLLLQLQRYHAYFKAVVKPCMLYLLCKQSTYNNKRKKNQVKEQFNEAETERITKVELLKLSYKHYS